MNPAGSVQYLPRPGLKQPEVFGVCDCDEDGYPGRGEVTDAACLNLSALGVVVSGPERLTLLSCIHAFHWWCLDQELLLLSDLPAPLIQLPDQDSSDPLTHILNVYRSVYFM